VITGFNTDIEHDGVVYHVQTEDKGLDTPIILSLVYVGGAILASKRAPYKDLIAEGFSDEVLSERLKRQHRLICAAINSGRINDLKKMSSRPGETGSTAPLPPIESLIIPEPVEEETATEAIEEQRVIETEPAIFETEAEEPEEVESTERLPEMEDFEIEAIPSQVWSPPEKVVEPQPSEPEASATAEDSVYGDRSHADGIDSFVDEGLTLLLLDDTEFNSGDIRTLRVLVVNRRAGEEKPVVSAAVSIKILGTAFRPLIYSLKSDRDGVATVSTQIPMFISGRAAVLIRAVTKDQAAELRRVIHPSK